MRIKIKVPTKKNIIMCVVAVCIVAVLMVFTLFEKEKDVQYDIVVLGDSVVGNAGEDGLSFTSHLGEKLGKSTFKGGLGGTGMSLSNKQLWGSMASMEWCMVKLAEAICYDDWKSQKATMAYADSYRDINNQTLYYFKETMDTLSRIDFSKVEILIIEHGTNDYNGGVAVDNKEDLYDVTTFGGALRQSLKLLQEAYPELRIVIMSPTYCALGENPTRKCYDTKYGEGGYLDEYVALEKRIAREFGVEFIDTYHDSGLWEDNATDYLIDNLHLNSNGHRLLGDFLAEYFEANQ